MEYTREAWVKASGGVRISVQELTDAILKRAITSADPWILLDLDHTLFETVHRSHHILREAAQTLSLPQPLKESLSKLIPDRMGFSIQDSFENHSIEMDAQTFESIRLFWWERFFGDSYLHHDIPFPGATDFVKRLHEEGLHICYLTARVESRMGKGTRESLQRMGFPWNKERTSLYMKRTDEESDFGHKGAVRDQLPSGAEVIASLENEPRNLVELGETFPEALHVLLNTKCSTRPAKPFPKLLVLDAFALDAS